MADLHRMDRTWLCSVLFMDIVKYSSESVDMQVKWKTRFNAYLGEAIRDVPEGERVILDTGDGAAVCFLGAPEAAMFAALHLWQDFVRDQEEQKPGLKVRIGVNLGPVKLVKDLNGSLNAIGDGINAGQRIMSFAPENQILVSQSFYEVVSRLSDDYKGLFTLRGVEKDKHVREHTVYSLMPPGSEKWHAAAAAESQPPAASTLSSEPRTVVKESKAPIENRPQKRSLVPLLLGGAVVVAAGAAGIWYFAGPGAKTASTPSEVAAVSVPAAPTMHDVTPAAPVDIPPSKAVPESPPKTETKASVPSSPNPVVTPAAASAKSTDSSPATDGVEGKVSGEGRKAYDLGLALIDQGKPTEAIQQFDRAIQANPEYV